MCGFFSSISKKNNDLEKKQHDNAFSNLKKRGPDEISSISENNVDILFYRLSIREKVHGTQPFRTSNGYWVFGNGEIFELNYVKTQIENKEFLKKCGNADILLAGEFLSQNPVENWAKIEGMFAIVLIAPNGNVYMGRDRVGEKPLFYANLNNEILISSLTEPIIASSSKKLDIDLLSTKHWLFTGALPSGRTFFQQINEVRPGCVNIISNGTETVVQYWSWPIRQNKGRESINVKEKLEMAVQRRIESDVPVSLALSAGIDSGAIFSILNSQKIQFQEKNQIKQLVTLKFNENSFDESKYLNFQEIQKYFEVQILNFNQEIEFLEIQNLVEAMDQPISDPACIGFYFISKSTARHSRVLVTGDGGDEIFLGYKVFEYQINVEKAWKFLNNMPLWMLEGLNCLLRKMPDSGYLTKINKVQRFFSALIFPSQQRWAAALSPHSAILPIFNKDYFAEVPIDFSNLEDYFRKLILPQVYLQKVDRMSMSNSLEVRSPYFDTDFIQAMCTISKKELIKHGKPTKKLISQHFYHGKVKKHGLGTPLIMVLGRINEPSWALEPLGISSEFLRGLWEKRKKSLAYAQSVWSLYVLNFYLKKWQDMGVLVVESND